MNGQPVSTRRWAHSPWLLMGELAVVGLLFALDYYHHIFFSKTPFLFLLAWASLKARGLGWKDAGLASFGSWARTFGIGISCGLGIELMELFLTQPLFEHLTGKPPDLKNFLVIRGNVKLAILFLLFAWTLAAFGEEMVYRGYLMNRVAGVFRNGRAGWIISLIAVSVLFGASHLGQGITGQLENALDGFLLGLMYLACGRNLSVPIVAHGVTDTVDLLLLFLGKYPGLG